MRNIKNFFLAGVLILAGGYAKSQDKPGIYWDAHRPQVHFSPKAHWMNDPNGMVYDHGIYHLFYQYYPGGTTWGPMHWGHAESKDLIHWKELPVALFPDSLGYIFSGSAVVDEHNTSGFGKNGQTPLVAIFTHHDPKGEKAGQDNFQNQSLAYSLDHGATWTKYTGNPVLRNPGIRDFRDPKVMWYAPEKKWVMTLATKDRITFYSSANFKQWTKESEFGTEVGAHGGVWECPDLFPLTLNGKTYWVLVVNLNPGGPNKGSATQYFVGQFNGKQFIPLDQKVRWLDYGPDEYAGVTWSNTGGRRVFLGWMSNWLYANQVPTQNWRNAMTIPRTLRLAKGSSGIVVASQPVSELQRIAHAGEPVGPLVAVNRSFAGPQLLTLSSKLLKAFALVLSNAKGEKLILGYNPDKNEYYIDRTQSGAVNFSKDFSGRFTAPRLTKTRSFELKVLIDDASVELFADGGLSTMTSINFPSAPFNHLQLMNSGKLTIDKFQLQALSSIW